ncbi:hypothetical protein BC477_12120 [Clavibacter michiganensis subsp. michiganensis]|uniref:Uncharacterized protein n=1 Tax=Clavibacter michiganensis subsp. michiganensis TaxID=33013 RepID=A0A251XID5_CLAMM|nr:hypothetical protein BC477_12120 [Clavibacter michiganensis subsp. michiganensis]OUE02542.1 hypothetical protein CMMCAS07_11030 [Clavibacter michiganensis subsp. michiganensis]
MKDAVDPRARRYADASTRTPPAARPPSATYQRHAARSSSAASASTTPAPGCQRRRSDGLCG